MTPIFSKLAALAAHLPAAVARRVRRHWPSLRTAWQYLSRGDVRGYLRLVAYHYRTARIIQQEYARWAHAYDALTDADRTRLRSAVIGLPRRPLISVVMPVYNPPLDHFRSAIESVQKQLYTDWELCVADDASTDERVRGTLRHYAAADPRIRVAYREQNGHISAASNSALALAGGEFVALLDQDDVLPEHALFAVAEEINRHPDCDILYSDEDKLDPRGRRFYPYFKPDWNWGLIRSQNMASHLGVYRTELVRRVGGFRQGYEGSQDYDLLLRCADATQQERIRHIPRVLYHWRVVPGSTAGEAAAKGYAHAAGVRALQDHFDRRGIAARAESAAWPGIYRARYLPPTPAPVVSIIVVATSHQRIRMSHLPRPDDAGNTPVEWVFCADEGRIDLPTAGRPGWTTVSGAGLNGSARRNRAARAASGELLCFLNPSLGEASPGWLVALIGNVLQSDVGAVGAKVVTKDGRIWHGGYSVTADVPDADPYRGVPAHSPGPFGLTYATRDCPAVSDACLAVRKDQFLSAGGFDEQAFPESYRDIDLCLRLSSQGLRTVWTPDASLVWRCWAGTAVRHPRPTNPALRRFRERWAGRLHPSRFHAPNLCHPALPFGLAFPPPHDIHECGRPLRDERAEESC